MPQELRFHLLGEPQIFLNDAPLTGFISSKSQALLIYLAASGRAHPREKLATLFWDEMADSAARKNLTKALSNIRKLIGDQLETDNQTASLAWDQNPTVDLLVFDQQITNATGAPSTEASTPAPVEQANLQKAVTLYRGDFLAAFHVKDAPLFEEWVWTERERLHTLALAGLQHLADCLIQQGNPTEATPFLQRLLEIDPLLEEGHLLLIQTLAQSGQRSAALKQYEQCQQILSEELGVEPNAELQAIYERVLKIGTPQPHNIPSLAPIIGREAEADEIQMLLREPGCRLLTIAGPGGIGKTRLALHVASSHIQENESSAIDSSYPDGVYFVALAPVSTVEGMIAAMAEALHFAFRDSEELWEQLSSFLQSKEMLLILDNFEQLLQQDELAAKQGRQDCLTFLTNLLGQTPHTKIIATSRIRLGMQSEHVFHLSGMEYPQIEAANTVAALTDGQLSPHPTLVLDSSLIITESQEPTGVPSPEMPVYGAVQLFTQNASRLRPDFTLTTENYPAVTAICHQVGGMPLGILLAASWITVLSPEEILTEISTSPDILETQERDVPSRQRSIRAAFDYTWQMLSEREQEIYQKLSIFRGDFTRQAAQQIAGASLRELMSMVDKSLISPAQDGRFSLHGLLRQFGIEKLAADQALSFAVRHQHCHFFAELMAQRARAFKGAEQVKALHETDMDSEDIRTAWQWAVQQMQIGALSQFIDGLCQYYAWRGRFQEGETVAHRSGEAFQISLDAPEAVGDSISTNDGFADTTHPGPTWLQCFVAKSLAWHGEFARLLGRTEFALNCLEQSLDQLSSAEGKQSEKSDFLPNDLDRLDLRTEKAFVWLHLGDALREQDKDVAQQNYERSLELYRIADDQWGAANALAALGWVVQHWGNYDEARQLYQDGLNISRELGDQRGEAEALRSVGGVALYQGDLEQAAKLIDESIVIAKALGDQVGHAAGLGKTGEILISLGRFSEAQQPLEQAKAIYRNLGLSAHAAYIDAIRGLAYLHLGFYDLAKNEADSALNFFQQEKSQRGIAYASLIVGWVMLAHEATATAKAALTEAVTIYEALQQRDELGQAHALLGLIAYQHGSKSQAATHLQKAQSIAQEIHAFMPHLLSQAVTIWHTEQQSERRKSNWLRTQIAHQPIIASSHWFAELLSAEE